MSLISELIPLNLAQEKAKFALDNSYNPQFIYGRDFSKQVLGRYGQAQANLVELAQGYLTQVVPNLPPEKLERKLSLNEISRITRDLFATLGLNPPIIHYDKLARNTRRQGERIFFPKSFPLSETRLRGILAHEVETHFLRSANQELTGVIKEKKSQYIRTEEGLAALNAKFMTKRADFKASCVRYLLVKEAEGKSFSELFALVLEKYSPDFEVACNYAFRVKRGLTDTSLGGGFSKDIVYLEGVLAVMDWMLREENNWFDLYLGKLSLEGIEQLRGQIEASEHSEIAELDLYYPTFFTEAGLREYRDFLQVCKQQWLGLGPL